MMPVPRYPAAEMNAIIPELLLPLGLLTLVASVLGAVVLTRALRARRRARQRVVERPNSHYTSQLARESDSRSRWHTIDLDRVHEINRGEVERLLARVDATSADTLRPNERAFLDHMAELVGTRAPVDAGSKDKSPPAAAARRQDPREAAAEA